MFWRITLKEAFTCATLLSVALVFGPGFMSLEESSSAIGGLNPCNCYLPPTGFPPNCPSTPGNQCHKTVIEFESGPEDYCQLGKYCDSGDPNCEVDDTKKMVREREDDCDSNPI